MRLLVTGGFGYIGGRLVEAFTNDPRFHIRVLARSIPTGLSEWAESAEVVMADVTKAESLADAFEGMETVVHLASLDEVECAQDQMAALEVNVRGTINVLQEAQRAGVKRFVYFSTLRAYGDGLSGVIHEGMAPQPTHPYGITHLAAEQYVRQATMTSDMIGMSMRLSNAVGAPLSGDVDRWSLVANDLCRQAATRGSIVLRSAGIQHRDFVAMADVVAATAFMATAPDESLTHDVYNLASGESVSIRSLAGLVQESYAEVFGRDVPLEAPDPATGETEQPLKVDVSRMQEAGFRREGDLKGELRQTLELCKRAFGR